MFWNNIVFGFFSATAVLTVNMKCFEILNGIYLTPAQVKINRKHEMFWNKNWLSVNFKSKGLTVNMKCFEIKLN